jgi:hypothetical protein
MRSFAARLILLAVAAAALGAAAYFVNLSERRIARIRGTERLFTAVTRDVITALSELRVSQSAYVAHGQDLAFWSPKAAAAAESVAGSITVLRSTATTDGARTALDAAAAKAAEFTLIDQRAREYLEGEMPLMASDVILSDGGENAFALTGHIEAARLAEYQATEMAESVERRREAMALGGAAAIALAATALLVLLGRSAGPAIPAGEEGAAIASTDQLGLRTPPENLATYVAARSAGASLRAVSKLCTDFGRVSDVDELRSLLGQAAGLMDASGLMVWVGSADGSELQPAVAHGYTPEMLARMPTLRRSADNAAAAAFRTGQLQIVLAHEGSTSGAIVAPMLASRGCVGVISAETQRGTETSESLQAMAAIFAAQLAGILQTTTPDTQEQRATGTI